MDIHLREFSLVNETDATLLTYWDHDRELHEIMGSLSLWEENQKYTFQERIERCLFWFRKTKDKTSRYVIEKDSFPIGHCSITQNPPYLASAEVSSAWLDIVIADVKNRSQGWGSLAILELESLVKESGIKRIEVGISEANIPSRMMFLKNGYQEFQRIEDEFLYKGQKFDDIRYEKIIS